MSISEANKSNPTIAVIEFQIKNGHTRKIYITRGDVKDK